MQKFSMQGNNKKNIVFIFLTKWIVDSEIMLSAVSQGTEHVFRRSTSASVLAKMQDAVLIKRT